MVIDVVINGETYRADSNYSITQQLGAVSTSTIDIKVESWQDVPLIFSECTILADGEPFYWGLIGNITSPEFSTGFEVRRYRLSLNSGESVFSNRLVTESFQNKYAHEIIQYLYTNYIAEEGYGLGAIAEVTKFYEDYNCSYSKLYDILVEIADDSNASFCVDENKDFCFSDKSIFEQIDAPTHITNLKVEEEKGDIRTVQVVTGASEETSEQTEYTYWTDGQTAWTLPYKVAAVSGFTINGATAGFGIVGIDNEDTSKTFLYEVGSYTITLNDAAATKPAIDDNVVLVFTGYYDIIVTAVNEGLKGEIALRSGTSGKIESVFTDETISNYNDANSKAETLLSTYSETEKTISCDCQELASTSINKMWLFAETDIGVTGQFVVTERTITSFGVDKIWVKLKLKNKNYFSRYGKVLVNPVKNTGADVKVYASSNILEAVKATGALTVDYAGLVSYPVDSSSTQLIDSRLGDFYVGV